MASRVSTEERLDIADQLEAVSKEIEERFSLYHSLLETQKSYLLEKVKKMRELYQGHCDLEKAILELERIRKATNEMLNESLNVGNKEEVSKIWVDKISDLKKQKSELARVSDLKLVDNVEEFSDCVKRIHVRGTDVVAYRERREPFVMKGRRGTHEGAMLIPMGLSVDKLSNQIFITDFFGGFVSTYSAEGDFIKVFGRDKLINPTGICVNGEFVYVSDQGNVSVFKFRNTGEFMCQTISEGEGAVELKNPSGLCVYKEQLYVCDYGDNSIKVMNIDLKFVEGFGEKLLKDPTDIKPMNEKLFILTECDNTIHAFNSQHSYLQSIPLTGQMSKIVNSAFFTIYLEGRFIISDLKGNCLNVFNQSGEYVESLGDGFLLFPLGIDIDNNQRIIIASSFSECNFIQIY